MARSMFRENQVVDGDFLSEEEALTLSGTLQTQIDGKSDLGHLHGLLDLYDTPDSYSDGLYLRSTTSGVEWATASGVAAGTLIDLLDTPTTYAGEAGKYVVVSDAEDSVLFEHWEWDPTSELIPETAISGTYFVNFEGGRLLIGATGNKPDLVYSGPIGGLAFADNKEEACYGIFKIPFAWNTESNIAATVNFMNDDTQTGTKVCSWRMDYHTYAEGEAYGDKTTTTVNVDTALPTDVVEGTFLKHILYMQYDDANNPLERGDVVAFKFYRDGTDAADTMTGDSVLLALMFELRVGQNIAGG